MKFRMTVALIVFVCILLTGCSKLTRENFDQVKVGMDYTEVVGIIGSPDKCDAALGAKSCVWGDDSKNITIKFVADKVVLPTMKGL